jgi:hypothetical protein
MFLISAVMRYFDEAFGDPDIPGNGPAFRKIRLAKSMSIDVLDTYHDYRATGGPPIPAWEARIQTISKS